MVKVVVLFYQAEEPKTLENYFYNHYLPMVLKIPGIVKVEITRFYSDLKKVFLKKTDSMPVYSILAELYFEDIHSFEEGFKTPEGEAIANDTIKVAWELVTVIVGDSITITPEEYENNPTFIRRFQHD